MLRALDSAGMPFAIYPFKKDVETRLTAPFLAERYDLTGIYEINIAYLAPPMLPFFYQELKSQLKGGGYTILRTYWELPEAPRQWAPLLEAIDELWAPNAFVADAFRGIFDGPITIVPVCIEVIRKAKYAREHFALDGDRFYFLFSFDYYSGPARKNPIGVVQAFSYAFPHDDKRVGLIIKATGAADLDPGVS
ncbi:MAG: hypothetical protein JO312_12645, partial [Hyphomicrobiales bacterium]|nr:hypothetical protein [Hyphomicrobiales bacterium]